MGGAQSSPLLIRITYFNNSTLLEVGLEIIIPSNRLPSNNDNKWLEIYQTTGISPPLANRAILFIYKEGQAGSPNVLVDDILLQPLKMYSVNTGATGITGVTGVTGPTGIGELILTNYLYTFDTTNQAVTVGNAVVFNTNGPLVGAALTHTVGTANIVINQVGTYVANFTLTAVQANQFSFVLNGVSIPGGRYGTGINHIQTTGSVAFTVTTVPSTLTLVNHTSTTGTVTLSNNEGGNLIGVSASISIFRIG
ncbi:NTTRR-F1 domain [Bacillus cereus]|nr:NTTRR-F1 domain [Bacillus cereus]